MNPQEIIDFLLTRKGQFSKAIWHRPCKLRKGNEHLNIIKQTSVVVRAGIDYEKMTSTIEGRANGALPKENAGLLPGQSWHTFPYLINSEKSGLLVRVYPNCGQRNITYLLNGEYTTIEAIAPFLLASELREGSHIQNIPITCFKHLS